MPLVLGSRLMNRLPNQKATGMGNKSRSPNMTQLVRWEPALGLECCSVGSTSNPLLAGARTHPSVQFIAVNWFPLQKPVDGAGNAEILVPGKTYQSLLLFVMAVILWAGIFVVATSPLLEISPILAVAAVGWASLIYRVNLRNSRWEWDRRIKDNEELQRLRIAAGKDEVNIGGVTVDVSDNE